MKSLSLCLALLGILFLNVQLFAQNQTPVWTCSLVNQTSATPKSFAVHYVNLQSAPVFKTTVAPPNVVCDPITGKCRVVAPQVRQVPQAPQIQQVQPQVAQTPINCKDGDLCMCDDKLCVCENGECLQVVEGSYSSTVTSYPTTYASSVPSVYTTQAVAYSDQPATQHVVYHRPNRPLARAAGRTVRGVGRVLNAMRPRNWGRRRSCS